jgi:hypothetical protein
MFCAQFKRNRLSAVRTANPLPMSTSPEIHRSERIHGRTRCHCNSFGDERASALRSFVSLLHTFMALTFQPLTRAAVWVSCE